VREIKRRTSKPLVAIGGITIDTASMVLEAGADSVAVISDLLSVGEISERTRRFLAALG
jgi:thiamine-phosphate pyrophosphorylase